MEERRLSGEYYTPESIVAFVAELARDLPFRRVLDPSCGNADLLAAVAADKGGIEVVGIDINRDILSQAEDTLKRTAAHFQLINAGFLSQPWDSLGFFDLAVCKPPFGRRLAGELDGLRLRSAEAAFVLQSLRLLHPEGYLIFVVPEGLLFSEANRVFREQLSRQYSLEAIISLAPGAFSPYTAIKTSLLIARKSKQTDRVFFAEYAEEQALKAIVTNLRRHTVNENRSQGFWVDTSRIEEARAVWSYSRFRRLEDFEAKKRSSRFPVRLLSELATIGPSNVEAAETILIPRVGTEPKVILKSELAETGNRQKYIECAITDDGVVPEYLKLYLNAEQGRSQLSSLASGAIPTRRAQDLGSLYVEVPDLDTQYRLVASSQQLLELSTRVQLASQSFYTHLFDYAELPELVEQFNQADKNDLAFGKLIWPLATSYRIATKGSPNITSQLDNYFRMFEMVAAFGSIVLLSAMPKDIRETYDIEIWTDKKTGYAAMSFGKWVGLYRRLGNIYTALANDKSEGVPLLQSLPFGKEFYLNLSDRELLKILDPIPQKRNVLGGATHGSATPEVIERKAVNNLHPSLVTVFEKLSAAYSALDLIYAQSMQKTNGLYTIAIKRLEGTDCPFAEDHIVTETEMDSPMLYLHNRLSGHRLPILPEFIKLIECELCGHWSMFLYSKVEGKKAHYRSYQTEIHTFTAEPGGLLLSFGRS
jgi:predicted RNA methylase